MFIGSSSNIIPIVPAKESQNPASIIVYGLQIKIISDAIPKLFIVSDFLWTSPAVRINIPIILALTTDAVNCVNAIKNMRKNIVIIWVVLLFFFPINMEKAEIIYVICEPETANMWVKLLVLKLFSISSEMSSRSPINIPNA